MFPRRWAALFLPLLTAACVAQQAATPIGDVNAFVSRYWNREIVVEGQVATVQADPIGTARGTFLLIDDSDRNGIRVQSKELPAPGEVVRLTGLVIQDPQNATLALLQERHRAQLGNPLFLYLMIASGALAAVLVGVLIYTLARRSVPVAAPAAPMWAPPAPPEPAHAGASHRRPPMDDVTASFRTPPVEDDMTVTFQHWGYGLEVVEGPDQGRKVQIGVSPFYIGRPGGRSNHLELSDRTVSRSQCAIRHNGRNGHFTLEHQGGTNSTYVDGAPVQTIHLEDGLRFRMGSTVVCFVRDGD